MNQSHRHRRATESFGSISLSLFACGFLLLATCSYPSSLVQMQLRDLKVVKLIVVTEALRSERLKTLDLVSLKSRARSRVEEALKGSGVRVSDEATQRLFVTLQQDSSSFHSDSVAVLLQVELVEDVRLMRSPEVTTSATTWSDATVILVGVPDLEKSVLEVVDTAASHFAESARLARVMPP